MPILDADQPINTRKLSELDILDGPYRVDKMKPEEIIVSKGDITIHLLGQFLITSGGVLKGLLQSIAVEKAELPAWDLSELYIDFVRFVDRIENGNLKHVIKDIFQKSDTIAGSHFDDKLYGGKGADHIKGWKGDDLIAGEEGRDELTGYAGMDRFVFGENLNYRHADEITDFKPGSDQIWLKKSMFTELPRGALDADAFVIGHGAEDKDDRIIYRPSSGKIFYDLDGRGGEGKTKFVTIDDHKDLTHLDFLVI
jgi:Ca2+-binding RTX toxin-like protein